MSNVKLLEMSCTREAEPEVEEEEVKVRMMRMWMCGCIEMLVVVVVVVVVVVLLAAAASPTITGSGSLSPSGCSGYYYSSSSSSYYCFWLSPTGPVRLPFQAPFRGLAGFAGEEKRLGGESVRGGHKGYRSYNQRRGRVNGEV